MGVSVQNGLSGSDFSAVSVDFGRHISLYFSFTWVGQISKEKDVER
jgi:hypothetical protein